MSFSKSLVTTCADAQQDHGWGDLFHDHIMANRYPLASNNSTQWRGFPRLLLSVLDWNPSHKNGCP